MTVPLGIGLTQFVDPLLDPLRPGFGQSSAADWADSLFLIAHDLQATRGSAERTTMTY
jgi:hypothetical protein